MDNTTSFFLPLLFFLTAATTVVPAVMILFVRDIVRCAFLLMLSFMGLSGLFILLGAEFLAFTLIMVYVGGILILILFGVMLTNRDPIFLRRTRSIHLVFPGAVCAALILAGLFYVILKVDWKTGPGEEDRLYLLSVETGLEGAEPGDRHTIDGWIDGDLGEAEKEGRFVLKSGFGAGSPAIAEYRLKEVVLESEEGEEAETEMHWVLGGISRVRILQMDEGGNLVRDRAGRLVEETLYGRLLEEGAAWVLHARKGEAVVDRFVASEGWTLPGSTIEALFGGAMPADALESIFESELRDGDNLAAIFGEEVPGGVSECAEALAGKPLPAALTGVAKEVTLWVRADDPRTVVGFASADGEAGESGPGTSIEERIESIGPALDETPEAIGKALMTDFLLPFEVASILLLAALIGATIIARRGGVEGV